MEHSQEWNYNSNKPFESNKNFENEFTTQSNNCLFFFECTTNSDTKNYLPNDLMRITGRKDKTLNKPSKIYATKNDFNEKPSTSNSNQKLNHYFIFDGDCEMKTIPIRLDPIVKNNLGRSSTVSERVLGFSTRTLADGINIIVSGFMPNVAFGVDDLKIGDWIKTINNQNVTFNNFDSMLHGYADMCDIELIIQRPRYKNPNTQNIIQAHCLSEFASISYETFVLQSNVERSHELNILLFSDSSNTDGNVLFSYPGTDNCLYLIRGVLLTLSMLLKSSFNSFPLNSIIYRNDQMLNISFKKINDEMLVLGILSKQNILHELNNLTNYILNYIQFTNKTMDLTNIHNVDWQNISLLLSSNYDEEKIKKINLSLGSQYLPLSKEFRLSIDGALNSLESMNYSSDDATRIHRDFYVLGSCIYYKSHLLGSHLSTDDQLCIDSFLRIYGLFHWLEADQLNELIVCKEIFSQKTKTGDPIRRSSRTRQFLSIVARKHILLGTILLSKENLLPHFYEMEPSLLYLEEIRETLDRIKESDIEELILQQKMKYCSISSNTKQMNFSFDQNYSKNDDSIEDDNSSDSEDNQRSVSNVAEDFLCGSSNIFPVRIIAGKSNVLYNFIQIDFGQMITLTMPDFQPDDEILQIFRQTCLLIHKILQNTKKFRHLLSEENVPQQMHHKSLVAIKEHGTMINIKENDESEPIEVWIVGRLFFPKNKELYVCYKSGTPQQLTEVAFRLAQNSAE